MIDFYNGLNFMKKPTVVNCERAVNEIEIELNFKLLILIQNCYIRSSSSQAWTWKTELTPCHVCFHE